MITRLLSAAVLLGSSLLLTTAAVAQDSTAQPADSLPPQTTTPMPSNSGLEVNEVRILGRRDAVEVKRDSGSVDYYSDRAGLFGADEGDGLGNSSALRVWRFGK